MKEGSVRMDSLNQTPRSERLHIAVFGKRNAGKSSLINAITNQQTALVSDTPGTTTDPVYKAMEISPIGPCVLIDTAGFDDVGELGQKRVDKTQQVLEAADVALVVCTDDALSHEAGWIARLREKKVPVVAVINKVDTLSEPERLKEKIRQEFDLDAVLVSAKEGTGIDALKEAIVRLVPEGFDAQSITGHLVSPGDTVLLVMPQDIQAPKGRLILPQVQTIRDLLDRGCTVVSATLGGMSQALAALSAAPKLIITDSQVFSEVYEKKPPESLLTSFSVLFARYKGDICAFVSGAAAIDHLQPHDRVLIAEACTHAPLTEDIGREKIPAWLKKKVGESLQVDVVSGSDFPENLQPYSLIIHCGACMFNRKYVMSRIEKARRAGVPITNYGVAIAKMKGILDKIEAW